MEISKINMKMKPFIFIIPLLILMTITGCVNSGKVTVDVPEKPTATEILLTETNVVSSLPPTITPTQLHTKIHPSKTPTPTLTPTLSATWAPPILNDYSIQTLIDTNGNCELPCWWGLVPGVTTKEQSLSFLEKVGVNNYKSGGEVAQIHSDGKEVIHEKLIFTYYLPGGGNEGKMELVFYDNVLSYIKVDRNTAGYRYQLESTLNKLGRPDEIFLYVTSWAPEKAKPYVFVLIYKDKRTVVAYGSDGFEVEENIQVCINNFEKPVLITWDDEFRFLERIDQIFLGGGGEHKLQYFEDATNLSIDDFYEQFTDLDGSDCFETSMEFWKDFP